MTFGESLVFYRNKIGITQKQLAEKIGITPTRLNYWEKDKRQPDVQMIKALAFALGVSGDELIGTGYKPSSQQNRYVSDAEFGLIEKYRTLDEYGKDMVSTVVEKEYERAHSTANAQRDYTRSVLTLAANADKAEPGSLSDDVLNDILAQADKLLGREKPRNDE